jgi:hypothetical protein
MNIGIRAVKQNPRRPSCIEVRIHWIIRVMPTKYQRLP